MLLVPPLFPSVKTPKSPRPIPSPAKLKTLQPPAALGD
jgi:hypothetical protein